MRRTGCGWDNRRLNVMSQDQFGESTRRAFLGTAAVATAATAVTLATSAASETASSVPAPPATGSPSANQIKVAQAAASSNQPTKSEPTTADWQKPAATAVPTE